MSLVLRGMQSGVAAVIFDVVADLGGKVVRSREVLSVVMMAAAFIASYFLSVNVIYIILAAIVIGVGKVLVTSRKEDTK